MHPLLCCLETLAHFMWLTNKQLTLQGVRLGNISNTYVGV